MERKDEKESATTVDSGVRPQHSKSHLRDRRSTSSRSSSSSSTSSSSSSSDSPRESKKKKSRTHNRRSKKQKRRDRRRIEKLTNDVGELRKTISNYENSRNYRDNESCISDVSRDLYNDCYASQVSPSQGTDNHVTIPELSFDIETKLKDPAVPKTPQEYLKMLDDVQRFGSSTWSDIRYSETQKLYNHSPGFTELETNEEVKAYDSIRHLAYSDKSYAALTFCILNQKEVFLKSLRNLIEWSKNSDASLDSLSEKIDEIFLKGDFHKVSADLLQMACGHRAETIEMRRDGVLKSVRDPLVRVSMNKIPPTHTHIFNPEVLTSTLEKAGGVRKAFWPINQPSSGNASRAKTTSAASRLPSQGHSRHNVPSHGHSSHYDTSSTYVRCHHNQPSQGNCQSQYFNPKGQTNAGPEQRNYNPYNRGSAFRSRGSRPYRQPQRGQKRHYSPSGYKGNKRQKQ